MTIHRNDDTTAERELVDHRPRSRSDASERPLDTRAWWRSWAIPLSVAVVAFLVYYIWPDYISFDPAKAQIVLREGFAPHYTILVLHIVSGTVAIATLCLQMWPWLRKRYPAIHRVSGQVYVFAGVVPTTLLIFALLGVASVWNASTLGAVLLSTLWLSTTLLGFRTGRQRRYPEHRRWMIRSFALGIAILWTRPTFTVAFAVPGWAGDLAVLQTVVGWAPWLLNLAIAEWWLYRTARRPEALRA
ncbi:DUF2306 domain-containing protein [Actinophytocola sp. KF-1]